MTAAQYCSNRLTEIENEIGIQSQNQAQTTLDGRP
jgi:hypothetical protein